MDFYQELVTQKSWQVLKRLKTKLDFILIGGWAVWLYTQALKSKDIDIIVDYDTLSYLKKEFEIVKNERLKKYEARVEEVEIDIYLPFYSNLGMPPEKITQRDLMIREGFKVPRPEILLVLKQVCYEARKASVKGEKDKLDIFSLLTLDLDFVFYRRILKAITQADLQNELTQLLKKTVRLEEINLNNHQMALLKKKILAQLA